MRQIQLPLFQGEWSGMKNKLEAILPTIFALITRHDREKVDIVWSSNSWTHNFFRFLELIFWRRKGIRRESSTWTYENKVYIKLYTLESVCAYLETIIRDLLTDKFLYLEVTEFKLAIANQALEVPFISFAIGLDTSAASTDTTTSPLQWNHTCTGSNLLIAVGLSLFSQTTGSTPSSVTYNSVGMTKANERTSNPYSGSDHHDTSIWLLHAPATGSNQVSATLSLGSVPHHAGGSISYTGAQQSDVADANNSRAGTTTGDTTFTVTTVADNCWVICVCLVAGTSPTLTADQTQRWQTALSSATSSIAGGEDTNGVVHPAGGKTVGWNYSAGVVPAFTMSGASFAPFTSAGVTTSIKDLLNHGFIPFPR